LNFDFESNFAATRYCSHGPALQRPPSPVRAPPDRCCLRRSRAPRIHPPPLHVGAAPDPPPLRCLPHDATAPFKGLHRCCAVKKISPRRLRSVHERAKNPISRRWPPVHSGRPKTELPPPFSISLGELYPRRRFLSLGLCLSFPRPPRCCRRSPPLSRIT
jgi:hypothetical protein